MYRRLVLFITLVSFLAACHRAPTTIEPRIVPPYHPKEVMRERRICIDLPTSFSTSPFPPLNSKEASTDWGKELRIALAFAEDFDLYRAITGFKRALHLLPPEEKQRRLEIEYNIALAYYLGKKYLEAVYAVEGTDLLTVDQNFIAFPDLLLILYDSYLELGREAQANHIFSLIEKNHPQNAEKLSLLSALRGADIHALCQEGVFYPTQCNLGEIAYAYRREAKSVRKAELYNALLPGAGYWYVGLRETAVTAFLINSLFIAAAAQFFCRGYIPAGIVTLSLESGWYFGGIYGAGLAAKSYNEHLYETYAGRIAQNESLFPVMMLQYSF